MATILIVHGAGSGGWLWQPVRRLLTANGHEVYTPTLTGVGERTHLATPLINLTTHIDDIVGVLEYEDLHEVVLVGHSYGGMVIRGVADRLPARLAQVIYLDAFVPSHNQSLLDLVPAPFRVGLKQQVAQTGAGWQVAPLPYATLGQTGIDGLTEVDAQRLLRKRVAQPFNTYSQPIQLRADGATTLPHTFIHCTDKPPGDVFTEFAQRARHDPQWRYAELATGHFPMLTMPGTLADLLLRLL